MDTSAVVSIGISLFSIGLSAFFAYTGYRLANKSDKTLASIQTLMDAQLNKFMLLIQDERKTHNEHIAKSMESMWRFIELLISYKGDLPKEKAENIAEEADELLQEIKQGFGFNPGSVLSDLSKVGEKEEHG